MSQGSILITQLKDYDGEKRDTYEVFFAARGRPHGNLFVQLWYGGAAVQKLLDNLIGDPGTRLRLLDRLTKEGYVAIGNVTLADELLEHGFPERQLPLAVGW
jgi:hypothetical protein